MNQWLTVAKLLGKSASAVVALFQNWQDQRLVAADDPTLISSEQWPAESRQAMIRLAREIRCHATEPPVVFYSEYVDMWSMADVFRRGFPDPTAYLYEVHADGGYCLWCYRMPDNGELQSYLHELGQKKHFAEETGRFIESLKQANRAWHDPKCESCILVIRQIVGGLVEDDEIERAAEQVPAWLRSIAG